MTKLEKLMDLTGQVQQLVEAGDWIAAADLERSRRPLVEAFLQSMPDDKELTAAGEVFEKVVALDARMIERIRSQRTEAMNELRREVGAGRAAKSYLANAGANTKA